MTENSMIGLRVFKNSIKNKLTESELKEFEYLIDSLTFDKLNDDEEIHLFSTKYDIILVDGTKFFNMKYDFDMNSFITFEKIQHPSVRRYEDIRYIERKLVKYYRNSIDI